jgi:hypothetical protein
MANENITQEVAPAEMPNTQIPVEPINDAFEPSSAAVRSALADALNEPEPKATRMDTVLSAMLWILYAAAVIAVLRGLWAAGDTIGRAMNH